MSHLDRFERRHIGPSPDDQRAMLAELGFDSLGALAAATVPADIRLEGTLDLPAPLTEAALLERIAALAAKNQIRRSYIGIGYYDTVTPPVIQRCILENPAWYTQYTPYQAEIAQGRLEMLLNFQTMVTDLTALPMANASLLDEATAAAEAMAMSHRLRPRQSRGNTYFVADDCHPQTIEVVRGRADALGLGLELGPAATFAPDERFFGVLVQYPATDGRIADYRALIERSHAAGLLVTMAADILALAVLVPPGELGADIAVGSTQRFGVPMGYGGPHAGYMATREAFVRQLPGRIIGVSKDAHGRPALRMAIQTREQHIRRDKATSNICTAQVLLANIAAAYAVYHGPNGIRAQAETVRALTTRLRAALEAVGHEVQGGPVFDTLRVTPRGLENDAVRQRSDALGLNFRHYPNGDVGVSLDTTTRPEDLPKLVEAFGGEASSLADLAEELPELYRRTSSYLQHPVFSSYHSETEMLRYLKRLESRDLSLAHAMIPLGSCTMKLNAAAEMLPITWPGFARLHPFVPPEQAQGYAELFATLEQWLATITGFDRISLQPNAGSQGEYAGLLVIRAFHTARGEGARNVCLIPTSAHGTNPASASMAGMEVVAVRCDERGNVDLGDLAAKATAHAPKLAALMVTYPSTHGVFEVGIREICRIVHAAGGQVYLDGANMNAQVGLCRPGDYGADVCHLNLHKTFCIPHGGGGPGVGPIGVKEHLAPFLPGHPLSQVGGEQAIAAIAAAPWGSAAILPIPWAYIAMMGAEGLTRATQVAILNANYIVKRLESDYEILYRSPAGLVAHECIIDVRPLKALGNVQVEDVAKRLIDYGFHAPTMSWPVAGTLMVEPTESESRAEIDRFCDAMIAIKREAEAIARGVWPEHDNPLRNAPHPALEVAGDAWTHPYPRSIAAWPSAAVRDNKFWPAVGRVDNAYGDRNVMCTCPPVDAYGE